MRDILSRVQKYIQIEDATRSAVDRSSKGEDKGEKTHGARCLPEESELTFRRKQQTILSKPREDLRR